VKKFEGKSVVVTGAGLGIGYGLCRAYAQEGAVVALNDIDANLAQEGANRINSEVGSEQVHAYSCGCRIGAAHVC
jgi:glucose 1-dehydrogenase